jgi:methylenetetrahydrofolate reductase (NADPH)
MVDFYTKKDVFMKITQLLKQNTPSLSFEVFPPKTESAFDSVKHATEEIAKLYPSFMSVTYGAGGGTSQYTLEIAKGIKSQYGVPTLAHLTCVSSTKETVRKKIQAMKDAGIENVMALRGDIPTGLENTDRSAWSYHYAIELVRELKESNADFCVGGACYPEIHPESADQREDIRRLKEKVDAGCDFLTTQMFFDNNLLYNFLYKIREAGINVPVIPGIMPITNAKQVERAIKLSGSFMPQRFKSLVDKFGCNPAAMKQAGIAYATDQIIDLYANGITNVHVYSMNKPDVAEKIQSNLSDILGK